MRYVSSGLLILLVTLSLSATDLTHRASLPAFVPEQDPCYAQLVNDSAVEECITDTVCPPPESTWCCTHKHMSMNWKICGVTPVRGNQCGPSSPKPYKVIYGSCQPETPHGCVQALPQNCPDHFENNFTLQACQ